MNPATANPRMGDTAVQSIPSMELEMNLEKPFTVPRSDRQSPADPRRKGPPAWCRRSAHGLGLSYSFGLGKPAHLLGATYWEKAKPFLLNSPIQ